MQITIVKEIISRTLTAELFVRSQESQMERDGCALHDDFFSVGVHAQLTPAYCPTKSIHQRLGDNLSQAVICQMSGVPVTGNHGGRLINKDSLRRWTCGSYICRRSRSFCSAAPSCNAMPAFLSISRKALKLAGGRRSGARTGCRDLAKICARSATA